MAEDHSFIRFHVLEGVNRGVFFIKLLFVAFASIHVNFLKLDIILNSLTDYYSVKGSDDGGGAAGCERKLN